MDIKQLPQVVMVIGLTALIGTVMVMIIGNFKPKMNVAEANDTANYGIFAIRDLLSWQSIVVIILIAAILIGAVVMFGQRRQL